MIFQESPPGLRRLCIPWAPGHQARDSSLRNFKSQPEQLSMNPGRTPARVGCSHSLDQITDLTTDSRPSRSFGFEFPEKLETLSVPADNGIRVDNDKRFTPRAPDSGKENPEKSIRHSNLRPPVRPFHHDQLLAKRQVLSSEIRGDPESQPNK